MPFDVEPTQLAMPEPPASSAQLNVTGTGRPCVNTAPFSKPLNVIVGATASIRKDFDWTAERFPAKSRAIHFRVPLCAIEIGSGSARARLGFHSVEFSVGVEPSSV